MRRAFLHLGTVTVGFLAAIAGVAGQQPAPAGPLRPFLKVDTPVFALTHVRVIDGTGAPPREDQTVVVRDGAIAAVGPTAATPAPPNATVIDGSGQSLMPG